MSWATRKYVLNEGAPNANIYKHLTLDNDGTTRDMRVDGSVTPQSFEYATATNEVVLLYSFGFELQDAKGFDLDEFGSSGGALASGIQIQMIDVDDNVCCDFTNSERVTTNADWYQYCDRVQLYTYGTGLGDDLLVGRTYIPELLGSPLVLNEGRRFRFVINDNLSTGYSRFHAYVAGHTAVGVNGRDGRK